MSDSLNAFRSSYDRITLPNVWVAFVLSLVLHSILLWGGLPKISNHWSLLGFSGAGFACVFQGMCILGSVGAASGASAPRLRFTSFTIFETTACRSWSDSVAA